MKYQELINEIRDLGFEDDATASEYLDIFNHAITRACRLIATLVKAPIGKIHLDLSNSLGRTTTDISVGSTTNPILINGEMVTANQFDTVTYTRTVTTSSGVVSNDEQYYFDGNAWQELGMYDLAELSKDENGNVRFDSIERITEESGAYIKTYLNYDIVEDHILVLPTSVTKELVIYYKERILPLTTSTPNDYEIQVVYPCEPLVALLAAHYIWLDDDERKAVMYWNEFDQLRQEIEARAFKPKARIVGGI